MPLTYDWEWESFERLLNNNSFNIVDSGPLRAPIRRFSISRDEKLKLIMETRAEQTATSIADDYPLGTVRVNTDAVTLSDGRGIEVVAAGVQSRGWKSSFFGDPAQSELREECSIHSLRGTIAPSLEPKHVIDWLANVDDSFLWPDTCDVETEITKTRTLCGGNSGPVLKAGRRNTASSRNCAKISVDGRELYLCAATPAAAKTVSKPGFILYMGAPTEEFRNKVRRCLSFSLGTYFVYLGCSTFSEDWALASFEAISAYSLGRKAFELPPLPPSPLGKNYEGELDRDVLSRMVNSIYSNYDALDFGHLSWAYWHAVCATPHIAAVHFCAVVEALQRSYLKANRNALKTKLFEREEWKRIKASAESAISVLAVDEKVKGIMKNKLDGLNARPQSLVTENLMALLQLDLGEREKRAWSRRNAAAHGGTSETEEIVDLIRARIYLTRPSAKRMMVVRAGVRDDLRNSAHCSSRQERTEGYGCPHVQV